MRCTEQQRSSIASEVEPLNLFSSSTRTPRPGRPTEDGPDGRARVSNQAAGQRVSHRRRVGSSRTGQRLGDRDRPGGRARRHRAGREDDPEDDRRTAHPHRRSGFGDLLLARPCRLQRRPPPVGRPQRGARRCAAAHHRPPQPAGPLRPLSRDRGLPGDPQRDAVPGDRCPVRPAQDRSDRDVRRPPGPVRVPAGRAVLDPIGDRRRHLGVAPRDPHALHRSGGAGRLHPQRRHPAAFPAPHQPMGRHPRTTDRVTPQDPDHRVRPACDGREPHPRTADHHGQRPPLAATGGRRATHPRPR